MESSTSLSFQFKKQTDGFNPGLFALGFSSVLLDGKTDKFDNAPKFFAF